MKKINNYIYISLFLGIVNLMVMFSNIKTVRVNKLVENNNLNKKIESNLILVKSRKSQEIAKNSSIITKKVNISNISLYEPKVVSNQSIETYYGNIAFYGSNCVGCSGRTANGTNIKNTIYYNDKAYGNIRILAGDKSYPFGTIVRMTYKNNEQVIGIILDRGGVGKNKKYQLDILTTSEEESSRLGVRLNSKIEILRIGF